MRGGMVRLEETERRTAHDWLGQQEGRQGRESEETAA
jgi:hypothetical protein